MAIGRSLPIINPLTGQPFSGNRIPDALINPLSKALIKEFYPPPTNPAVAGNNLTLPLDAPDRRHAVVAKIDHRFGAKDSLFGRYIYSGQERALPADPGVDLPQFATEFISPRQDIAIGHTHVFSPSLLAEFRVSYNRLRFTAGIRQAGNDINRRFNVKGVADPTAPPDVIIPGFANLSSQTSRPIDVTTNQYNFHPSITYSTGSNTLKIGFQFLKSDALTIAAPGERGIFRFTGAFTRNSFADFLLGFPFEARTISGPSDQITGNHSSYAYIHDDWRVRPNLTFNIGLRYEYNEPISEARNRFTGFDFSQGKQVFAGQDGVPVGLVEPDYNNFAPRIGFAYRPFSNNKTVIRGGYGIFYDALTNNQFTSLRLASPFNQTVVQFNTLPNLINYQEILGTNVRNLPLPLGSIQRNLPTAYRQQWNFNVQRSFADVLFELAYVGAHGVHFIANIPRNAPVPNPAPNPNSRRPFPAFSTITTLEPVDSNKYHALQLRVEKRPTQGTWVLASYTYGKSIGGIAGPVQDPTRPLSLESGLSIFDVRHRLALSFLWDLPFGRGRTWGPNLSGFLGGLISEWQVNGIATFQTGFPFTPQISFDVNNNTVGGDRPNLIGNPKVSDKGPNRWFDRTAFSTPPAGTNGNAGPNSLTGPGINNVDLALFKNTQFGKEGRYTLQTRVEFFNLFNHPQFDRPVALVNLPTAGQITAATIPARQIQFGFRFLF